MATNCPRPGNRHTELEEELHEHAHIDYNRVAIVCLSPLFVKSYACILTSQIANPSVPALYEDALVYETGSAITSSGALSAYSGAKTGRSPSDKRVVKEESSENDVWWGPVNKPMTTDVSFLCYIFFAHALSLASSRSSFLAAAFFQFAMKNAAAMDTM